MTAPSKEEVQELRKETELAYTKFHLLKEAYEKASVEYLKKSKNFQEADYQLALEDGRLKKLPAQGERKEKKQPELTIEQLRGIAAKLGIKIPDEDEDEEINELDENELIEDETIEILTREEK